MPRTRTNKTKVLKEDGHSLGADAAERIVEFATPDYEPISLWLRLALGLRFIPVILVLLPMSKFLDWFWQWRDFFLYDVRAASDERHDKAVEDVQEAVRRWIRNGRRGQLCTARNKFYSISQRYVNYKQKDNAIPINLPDILGLDEVNGIVRVEPLVTVGRLSHYLSKRGYTLPVTPEMDDLTMGGMFMGYGIESSSHVEGLFNDCVESADIVLGDGTLVHCTADNEHRELFHALPWSYGSLGFLVCLELRVIPAGRYVKLRYEPVHGLENICARFEQVAMGDVDSRFLECLVYTEDSAVIMTGEMVDDADPAMINAINSWHKPLFFRHVEAILRNNSERIEYVPLRHYFHRHTRGIFWVLEDIIPFANHWLFRWPLGWLLPVKVAVLRATQSETVRDFYQDRHVAQDFLVPIKEMQRCIEWCDEVYDVYPIWLCPHKTMRTEPAGMVQCWDPPSAKNAGNGSTDGQHWQMYVDVGIYGVPSRVWRNVPFSSAKSLDEVQAYLRSVGGYQALYSVTNMTEEEFDDMFPLDLWRKMRKKYNADVFLTPYQKICSGRPSKVAEHTNVMKKRN